MLKLVEKIKIDDWRDGPPSTVCIGVSTDEISTVSPVRLPGYLGPLVQIVMGNGETFIAKGSVAEFVHTPQRADGMQELSG
jgi:hypothetical protein